MAKLFGKEKDIVLKPETAPKQQPEFVQPKVEQPVAVEQLPSTTQDTEQQKLGALRQRQKQSPQTQPLAPTQKTELRKDIEELMSEGLTEVYQAMTPDEQQAFRQKGEEVASKIEMLVTTFHAKARQVIALIREWLKLIPGINKYFLEQESKLKTDAVLKYQRTKKADAKQNRFL